MPLGDRGVSQGNQERRVQCAGASAAGGISTGADDRNPERDGGGADGTAPFGAGPADAKSAGSPGGAGRLCEVFVGVAESGGEPGDELLRLLPGIGAAGRSFESQVGRFPRLADAVAWLGGVTDNDRGRGSDG